MKGIAPIIIGIMIVLISVASIGGYIYFSDDDVEILQSTTPLTFGANKESIIPAFAIESPNANVEVIGSDFVISCDKTVYGGLTSITVLCDVTNRLDEIVYNKDVGMLFSPSLAKISTVYLWDENLVTGTYCSEYIDKETCVDFPANDTHDTIRECYTTKECSKYTNTYGGYEETNKLENDVRGLTFGKSETKQFKFIISVPMGSTGKFDVLAGDTILDPWWDATWGLARNVTLTNPEAKTHINEVIHVQFAHSGVDYNNNCSDIRVVNNLGNEITRTVNQTAYWWADNNNIESINYTVNHLASEYVCNSTHASVMFFATIPASSSIDYTIYYNKVGVGEPVQTSWPFYIYDDFENYDAGGFTSNKYFIYDVHANEKVEIKTDQKVSGSKSLWTYDNSATNWAGIKKYFYNSTEISTVMQYRQVSKGSDFYNGYFVSNSKTGLATYQHTVTMSALNTWYKRYWHTNITSGYFCVGATGDPLCTSLTTIAHSTSPDSTGFQSVWKIEYGSAADESYLDDLIITNGNIYDSKATYIVGDENIRLGGDAPLEILSDNSSATAYETVSTILNITVNSTQPEAPTITGNLNWNGTIYSATMTNATPYVWRAERSVIPPLITSNGQSVNWFWNLTVNYNNGTIVYNNTNIPSTQTVNYAYYWGAPVGNTSTASVGDAFQFNASYTALGGASIYNVSAIFNNTQYTPTLISARSYYHDLNIPVITSTTNFNYGYSLSVSYGGNVLVRSSTVGTLAVEPIYLFPCNGTGTPFLKLNIWDEEGFGSLNASVDATFKAYADATTYSTYNFTYAGNHTHYFCVYPNTTSSFTVDADIKYANLTELYPERFYYLRQSAMTNVTSNINLYLLNSTYASNVKFQVINPNSVPQSNVVVNVQRYYEGLGAYYTVAMGVTDENGYTNIRLRAYDAYYRILVIQDGVIVKTFVNQVISSDSNILIIPTEIIGDYWIYHDKIAWGCIEDAGSFSIICEAVVTDGTQLTFGLNAWEMRAVSTDVLCEETGTGNIVSLVCAVGDWTDRNIKYTFYADYTYNHDILLSSYIGGVMAGDFGVMGLFFILMLVIGFTFAGLYNPAVALSMTLIALVIGMALGIMTISYGALISIVLVIIIAIARVRS